MKKIVYFIPFILFVGLIVLLYPLGLYGGWGLYITIALFLLSGVLLTKGKWWGGVLGMFPGVGFIFEYFCNIIHPLGKTGLVVGVLLILFYAVCTVRGFLLKKKEKR